MKHIAYISIFALLLFSCGKSSNQLNKEAETFEAKGEFYNSIPLLEEAIKKDPENKYALINLGVDYSIIGDYHLAIEFKLIEKPLEFPNIEYKKYDISLFENFKIQSKSKIHKIISFINHLQLNWKAENGIDKDSLTIKIENGPYIVFDLYDGTVDKITIVDGHQKD